MPKKEISKEGIRKGFQDYLLTEAKEPETVRIFVNYLKIPDASFFNHFGSLKRVEASIWEMYYRRTLHVLNRDPDFKEMNPREKHLAFLFTLLESVKEDRAYIQYRLKSFTPMSFPRFLTIARQVVDQSAIDWVDPPGFIPEKGHSLARTGYKKLLWEHSLATIRFWIEDDSEKSSDTDAFIEKSTRTLFDLGALPDSVLDLGKFFLQKIGLTKAATV